MMETPSISNFAYTSNAVQDFAGMMAQHRIGGSPPPPPPPSPPPPPPPAKKGQSMTTRVVQVFIADTDENLELDDRLLYRGDQKLTDLTDQELFFEIDIKTIIDKHNAKRTTTLNKKVKERVEYLEPVRIRELKMTVVDIAKF
jgi:hypothetical protein